MKTSIAYRATWLEFLLWKVCVIVAFVTGIATSLADGRSVQFALAAGLLMAFLFGLLGGFIVSMIVAFPLQLLIDLIVLPIRKLTEDMRDPGT
ncbi:MAG: hypothetical protein JXB04_08325 [Kiritimatiellae bacterium]|nr:hypothetical protein [Kiritimatiellia bacterium]